MASERTERLQQIAFGRSSPFERQDDGAKSRADLTTRDAFDALVNRQSRFVFRVAYSVLRNVYDSDDVVQETFLKLYRSRKWESIQNERSFLARAAWRMALDRLPTGRIDVPDATLPSNERDPEQEAIAADSNAVIHRLIDSLPEDLRQPLALSTVDELNSHEIAAVMGIPEGTVRSRLSRARQVLKQKLENLRASHGH